MQGDIDVQGQLETGGESEGEWRNSLKPNFHENDTCFLKGVELDNSDPINLSDLPFDKPFVNLVHCNELDIQVGNLASVHMVGDKTKNISVSCISLETHRLSSSNGLGVCVETYRTSGDKQVDFRGSQLTNVRLDIYDFIGNLTVKGKNVEVRLVGAAHQLKGKGSQIAIEMFGIQQNGHLETHVDGNA